MSKTTLLASLMTQRLGRPVKRLLVVGCGDRDETLDLGRSLNCDIVGVDIVIKDKQQLAPNITLQYGDAHALPFPSGHFDFVFSYHALEHMTSPELALSEMRRVLAPGGAYCIGTPNRDRLIGYLGSAGCGWRKKLRMNVADWKAQLLGEFRNEFGAHAGFTRAELAEMLSAAFGGSPISLTRDYYLVIYPRQALVVRCLELLGLGRFLLPSAYYCGTVA
jgi:SAM-dependent methyltransferase